jgi:hypothetical protein
MTYLGSLFTHGTQSLDILLPETNAVSDVSATRAASRTREFQISFEGGMKLERIHSD